MSQIGWRGEYTIKRQWTDGRESRTNERRWLDELVWQGWFVNSSLRINGRGRRGRDGGCGGDFKHLHMCRNLFAFHQWSKLPPNYHWWTNRLLSISGDGGERSWSELNNSIKMPTFMEIYHQTIMIMSQLHWFFFSLNFFSSFPRKRFIQGDPVYRSWVKAVGCELRPTEDVLPSNRSNTIEINEATWVSRLN